MPTPTTPSTSPGPHASVTRRERARRLLRRQVWGRRRLLAAAAAGVATLAALRVVAPPPPPTVAVVVASAALPAGTVLDSDDVEVTRWPATLAPPSVVATVESATGRVLSGPVGAGEAVTATRLLGADRGSVEPGRVVVPVRMTDPAAAALLHSGDVVDLVATPPQDGTTRVVATAARVVSVAERDDSGVLPGRLVVVSVTDEALEEVTQASVHEFVTWTFAR